MKRTLPFLTLWIIIIANLFPAHLSAQDSLDYSVLFVNPLADEVPMDILEDSIGTYYAVGYARYGSAMEKTYGVVYRVKSATDTLYNRISFHDTLVRFSKIIPGPGRDFTILGVVSNPPDYSERLMIAFMDMDLNFLSRKEYTVKDYTGIDTLGYIVGKDHSLWIYGSACYKPEGAIDFFVWKMSSTGDTLKKGEMAFLYPYFFDGLFSRDSTQLWFFGQGWITNAMRAVFDSNLTYLYGDVLYDNPYPNLNVRWLAPQTILLCGNYIFPQLVENEDMGISFIDTSLVSRSLHYYGTPDTLDNPASGRCIDFREPKRIFYVGVHNMQSGLYPHGASWILTGLTDTTFKQTFRLFYGGDAFYSPRSIVASKDEGSMVLSSRYDYHTQANERDVLFLKFKGYGSPGGIEAKGDDDPASIRVYPNPGRDFVRIEGKVSGSEFELYDPKGYLVLSVPLVNGRNTISTLNLPSNEYFIYKITRRGKKGLIGKWIRE